MLLIDPRVGHTPAQTQSDRAEGMIKDLRRMGIPAHLRKLEFGDVSFDGYAPDGSRVPIGIELKTVTGLLTDMTTGRFAGGQVAGMQRAYPYRYLFIEGATRPSLSDLILEVPGSGGWHTTTPRIMYADFLKFVDDIDLRGGFHIRRPWGRMDTLCHITAEYQGWQKPWDKHKGLKHFNEAHQSGVVHLTPPTLLRLWARDLPLIGWEKSEAVERTFNTPLSMAMASIQKWRSIQGIGEKIARTAWERIRGIE